MNIVDVMFPCLAVQENQRTKESAGIGGHWVTIEGEHVLMKDLGGMSADKLRARLTELDAQAASDIRNPKITKFNMEREVERSHLRRELTSRGEDIPGMERYRARAHPSGHPTGEKQYEWAYRPRRGKKR